MKLHTVNRHVAYGFFYLSKRDDTRSEVYNETSTRHWVSNNAIGPDQGIIVF